jgi:hypothetical protein
MNPVEYHFIFFDIVGLSNPALSTEKQVNKINILNAKIKECPSFKDTPKEKRTVLPTGDGAAIGFKDNFFLPLDLAKELHEKLNEYNSGKQWLEQILLHTGLHSDRVFKFTDLDGKENVWGEGIIIAQRIMSKAPAGFILLSEQIGEKLASSTKYKEIIYHAGYIQLKYQRIFVWYAYDDNFGRNDISEIKDLNEQVSEFSAEIVGQKPYKLGETISVKVDFTGKLESGFYDVMLRAPIGKTFPDGKKNKWIPDPNTYSDKIGSGTLCGEVAKVSNWSFTIEKNFPIGIYKVYIRVYENLSQRRRPVIREKVETLYIT